MDCGSLLPLSSASLLAERAMLHEPNVGPNRKKARSRLQAKKRQQAAAVQSRRPSTGNSRNQLIHHRAMHVCQTEVAASVAVSELFVVESDEFQNCSVQIVNDSMSWWCRESPTDLMPGSVRGRLDGIRRPTIVLSLSISPRQNLVALQGVADDVLH